MKVGGQGFVTGGTWCADYNLLVASWPREETANPILGNDIQGGGSGCNFSVDMRKLDPEIPVATIGIVGNDGDGVLLRAITEKHGIDGSRMIVSNNGATHRTMAFTALDTKRRTHLFEAGVNDALSPDHFDFDGLEGRMLHLGLPGTHAVLDGPWGSDPNGWVAVLRKAKTAGLETNLELMSIAPERLRDLVRPCLHHLDFLVVNDWEIGAIANVTTLQDMQTDVPAVLAAMRKVIGLGAMKLVVVHFPEGALALTREGAHLFQPSVKVPEAVIVGANGAGDAFAAGMFCGLYQGRGLKEALELGHASAAASLRSSDTTGAVEEADNCLGLARQWGWRPHPENPSMCA